MTSLRQKPKHTLETPVLFRLPDLRIHGPHAAPGWPKGPEIEIAPTAIPDAGTFRIDPPQAINPVNGHKLSGQSIHPDQPPTESHSIQTVSTTISSAVEQSARGWMERFGSRVILVVTLLVILTAAWVTGKRMPAAKPNHAEDIVSIEPDSELSIDAGETTTPPNAASKLQSATDETDPSTALAQTATSPAAETDTQSKSNDLINTVSKPAVESPSALSLNQATPQPTQEMSAILALEAPRSVHDDTVPPLAAAPAKLETEPPLPANPTPSFAVQPHSPNPYSTPVQSVAHDLSGKPSNVPGLTLAPAATDQSFYSGAESIEPLPNAAALQTTSEPAKPTEPPTSQTPNQIKIDPNVLVPWANEHAAHQPRQHSPTPNAILNWNDYLPASPSNVRAASAQLDPAQPQVGMPPVSSVPEFSNSFYTN